MAIPVALRGNFKASQLRGLARKTNDGPQARRLLAVAAIYDGATRAAAAKIGGVGLQIIRDWVMRFNARGRRSARRQIAGQPAKLNDVQRQAIVRMIDPGDPRCSALAANRPFAMDRRGVPHHGRQTDVEPGASRDGLPQALSTTPPSCASGGSNRGF
jgi:transposase